MQSLNHLLARLAASPEERRSMARLRPDLTGSRSTPPAVAPAGVSKSAPGIVRDNDQAVGRHPQNVAEPRSSKKAARHQPGTRPSVCPVREQRLGDRGAQIESEQEARGCGVRSASITDEEWN